MSRLPRRSLGEACCVLTGSPGQAAYFGINDTHGLCVAEGHDGASFLEFHIPAAFTTVKLTSA